MTTLTPVPTFLIDGRSFQPEQAEILLKGNTFELRLSLRSPSSLKALLPVLEPIKPAAHWQAIAYSPGSALQMVYTAKPTLMNMLEKKSNLLEAFKTVPQTTQLEHYQLEHMAAVPLTPVQEK